MKMMVKLAVLFATFVLVAGVAFASPTPAPNCPDATNYCECYKVTANDLTNPAGSWEKDWRICLSFNNKCGAIAFPVNGVFKMFLTLFFEGLSPKMTGSTGNFDGASLKFHGDNLNVLTGELVCFGNEGNFCGTTGHRYTIWGHIEECPAP